VSGFDARLLVWVKPRKTQHEQIFLAVPPIADILSGLRFGFVNLQQARLLFHNRSLCELERHADRGDLAPRTGRRTTSRRSKAYRPLTLPVKNGFVGYQSRPRQG
jgi:hypothetical protein